MTVLITFDSGRSIEVTRFALFWMDQFGTRQYTATEEFDKWADRVAATVAREDDAP